MKYGIAARRALLALGAALALSTPASFAQVTDLPTVRIGAALDVESTPVLYAQKAGLFAKAGLNVEIVKLTGGGTAIAAAIAGGGLDVGKASTFALVAAHARGVPFVLLAPAAILERRGGHPARRQRGFDVQERARSRGEDDRRRLALDDDAAGDPGLGRPERGRFAQPEVRRALAARDAARDRARPHHGAPLSEPVLSDAMSTGKIRVLGYPYNAIGKHFELADWFSSADWVAKNHDAAAKFARVMFEANKYVAAHESEITPLVAAYVGLDPSTLAKMRNPERGRTYDPALIQPLIDLSVKYKAIAKGFPAAEMISDAALKPQR